MTRQGRIGLLGGTFDPIHVGHLDAASAACEALGLDELRIVPAHDPPHRPLEPRTSAYHRFALAALAIDGRRGWRLSDVELLRPGPSYSIDTLRALHADGWPPAQIYFILGTDAFADIATWRAYPDLLDAAHFAVIARPGTTIEQACARVPELRARTVRVADGRAAADTRSGGTYVLLVEAHTRDVSSTRIRERAAHGQSIDDLVPPPVARHILAHQLYQPMKKDVNGLGGTER